MISGNPGLLCYSGLNDEIRVSTKGSFKGFKGSRRMLHNWFLVEGSGLWFGD